MPDNSKLVASDKIEENISVSVRVRPLNNREQKNGAKQVWDIQEKSNSIYLSPEIFGKGASTPQTFDNVFSPSKTTDDVYDSVAKNVVSSVLTGMNGTIFAYGQTASGKTHTMQGSAQHPGILPLAAQQIFDEICEMQHCQFLLHVSYIEIYNEQIKDLLGPNDTPLRIREDPDKGFYVENVEKVSIVSVDELLQARDMGEAKRHVGVTNMNEKSSRSHTVFTIKIEMREAVTDGNEDENASEAANRRLSADDYAFGVRVGQLNLVDLAGSENARNTGAAGERLKEGANINRSLLSLSRVISQLAQANGKSGYINFRDSKLTQILQPSLAGNCRTAIVCCVTPASQFLDETKSTLSFAGRAKEIRTQAIVNEILDEEAEMKKLKRTIAKLKSELASQQAANVEKAELEQKLTKLKTMLIMGGLGHSDNDEEHTTTVVIEEDGKRASLSKKRKKKKKLRETWCPGANAPVPEFIKQRGGLYLDAVHEANAFVDNEDVNSPLVKKRQRKCASMEFPNSQLEALSPVVEQQKQEVISPSVQTDSSNNDNADVANELNTRIEQLQVQCEELRGELDSREAKLSDQSNEMEQFRIKSQETLACSDMKCEDLTVQLVEKAQVAESARIENDALKKQVDEHQTSIDSKDEELKSLRETFEEKYAEQIDTIEDLKGKLHVATTESSQDLSSFRAERELEVRELTTKYDIQVSELTTRNSELQAKLNELEETTGTLQSTKEQVETSLQQEIGALKAEIAVLKASSPIPSQVTVSVGPSDGAAQEEVDALKMELEQLGDVLIQNELRLEKSEQQNAANQDLLVRMKECAMCAQEEIDMLRMERRFAAMEVKGLKQHLESAVLTQTSLENQLQQAQQNVSMSTNVESLEEMIETMSMKIDDRDQQIAELNDQIDSMRDEALRVQRAGEADVANALASVNAENQRLTEQMAAALAQVETMRQQNDEEVVKLTMEIMARDLEVSNAKEVLDAQLQDHITANASLKQVMEQLKAENVSFSAQLEQARLASEEATMVDETSAEIESITAERDELQRSLEAAQEKLQALVEERDSLVAQSKEEGNETEAQRMVDEIATICAARDDLAAQVAELTTQLQCAVEERDQLVTEVATAKETASMEADELQARVQALEDEKIEFSSSMEDADDAKSTMVHLGMENKCLKQDVEQLTLDKGDLELRHREMTFMMQQEIEQLSHFKQERAHWEDQYNSILSEYREYVSSVNEHMKDSQAAVQDAGDVEAAVEDVAVELCVGELVSQVVAIGTEENVRTLEKDVEMWKVKAEALGASVAYLRQELAEQEAAVAKSKTIQAEDEAEKNETEQEEQFDAQDLSVNVCQLKLENSMLQKELEESKAQLEGMERAASSQMNLVLGSEDEVAGWKKRVGQLEQVNDLVKQELEKKTAEHVAIAQELEQAIRELENQQQTRLCEVAQLREELALGEQRVAELSRENVSLNSTAHDLRSEVSKLQEEVTTLETPVTEETPSEQPAHENRTESLEQELRNAQEEIETLAMTISSKDAEIGGLNHRVTRMKQQLDSMNQELMRFSEMQTAEEAVTKELEVARKEVDDMKLTINNLQMLRDDDQEQMEALEKKGAEHDELARRLASMDEEHQEKLANLTNELMNIHVELESKDKRVAELTSEKESLSEALDNAAKETGVPAELTEQLQANAETIRALEEDKVQLNAHLDQIRNVVQIEAELRERVRQLVTELEQEKTLRSEMEARALQFKGMVRDMTEKHEIIIKEKDARITKLNRSKLTKEMVNKIREERKSLNVKVAELTAANEVLKNKAAADKSNENADRVLNNLNRQVQKYRAFKQDVMEKLETHCAMFGVHEAMSIDEFFDMMVKHVQTLEQQKNEFEAELSETLAFRDDFTKMQAKGEQMQDHIQNLMKELDAKNSLHQSDAKSWSVRIDDLERENQTLAKQIKQAEVELQRNDEHDSAMLSERDEEIAMLKQTNEELSSQVQDLKKSLANMKQSSSANEKDMSDKIRYLEKENLDLLMAVREKENAIARAKPVASKGKTAASVVDAENVNPQTNQVAAKNRQRAESGTSQGVAHPVLMGSGDAAQPECKQS